MLAVAALSVGTLACGKASTDAGAGNGTDSARVPTTQTTVSIGATTSTPSSGTSAKGPAKTDLDHDSDNNNDDYGYGQAASPADMAAVVALLERYYAAAAANNGAAGCTLIYSLLAEEIPEVYGEPPGPPDLRGKTCEEVMSKLFKEHHKQLVIDHATLKVKAVRVHHLRALAIMSFKGMPQRDIAVHREHSAWKVDELLDGNLG